MSPVSFVSSASSSVPLRVLIVKLSSLGDVVHAMPAVQDLLAAYPQAQVDWVVERGFAPLAQRCAGVQHVIPCDLRRWRKSPFSKATLQAWARFKTELQAQAYDAVIDLQGLSKSALIAWLARTTPQGQRYAMANATDGSSYEAPTRWVADRAITLAPHVHAVERSRLVCATALGYTPHGLPHFGLRAQTSADQGGLPVVALVHGTSRADKEWPQDDWVWLAQQLIASGYAIALPHGNAAELARSHAIAAQINAAQNHAAQRPLVDASPVQVWPSMGLDAMCDALAGCAAVIGVDSGLSHIAVALDLPHVQLYNFDTAWRTGPSADAPAQRSVFAQPAPSRQAVWQAWLSVIAQRASAAQRQGMAA